MITYVGKFEPNFSQRAQSLRELLKKDIAWHWSEKQESCIADLKQALSTAPVLVYFDLSKPITVSVDASSAGLEACLLQNKQPVAYASRSLNSAEKNYAQIEKEMLAIAWGCIKFHDYINGRSDVVVETDHKPLESLFRKTLVSAQPRIQRMMLRVQKYDLKVMYHPGKELYIADTLSCAVGEPEAETDEYEVHAVDNMPIGDQKLHEFVEETDRDPGLQTLKKHVVSGWPETKSEVPSEISAYWSYRDEISVCDGLLLKSERLIVPTSLRSEMLRQIHRSHLGIVKCRQRARDVLFWPQMNAEISQLILKCPIC